MWNRNKMSFKEQVLQDLCLIKEKQALEIQLLTSIQQNLFNVQHQTNNIPAIQDKLNAISKALKIGYPVKFQVIEKGDSMSKNAMKATVDFQLADNGTAKLTATPVDAAGLKATLPDGTQAAIWASSDPGVVITVDASDPTGLTATAAPANPPVLVTGAVPTVSLTLPDGTTISGSGNAIDVVGGGPTGFQVQES